MRSLMSMLLTLFMAVVILALGYLGIVETGKKILKSEETPEQAAYENAGSNIFYGKIEDDIRIFPWNYYTGRGKNLEKGVPEFLLDALLTEQNYYDAKYQEGMSEEALVFATDWYFGQLIAYEAGVDTIDVCDWLDRNEKHIYYNMREVRDTPHGNIFFFQENLELGGRKYQVRIACGEWSVISFSCALYDPSDRREQEQWKRGKEHLVAALEKTENHLEDYVIFMTQVEYMSVPSFYMDEGGYENAYLRSFQLLDYVMQGKGDQSQLVEEMREIRRNIKKETIAMAKEKGVGADLHYSYQVVELKDMILLLVQGELTIGIYYDPVNQAFCGYNYFSEY